MPRSAAAVFLLAASCTVSGCYFGSSRILDRGLDAGIPDGQYECRFQGHDRALAVALRKTAAGRDDTVYAFEYDNPPGRTKASGRLGKLGSGLSVLQVEGLAPGQYAYSFVTVRPPAVLEFALQRQDYAAKAAAAGLTYQATPGWFVPIGSVSGSREATLAFLGSFSPAELQPALRCKPQAR